MKLASFNGGRPGLVRDGSVVDLSELLGTGQGRPGGGLGPLIDRWPDISGQLVEDRLANCAVHALESVRLDPPVLKPGKVVAAPVNYRDHQQEMDVSQTVAELGVFLKAPSSVTGSGSTVFLPYTDRRTDQEGEFAAVIGRVARHVTPEDALDHVFGYTCLLDITVRGQEDRSVRKSFDTFTPIGPWVTTTDEIADCGELDLRCWVNGELRQAANTRDLLVGLPELISYASSVMTLHPGDVVTTGTPAGVAPLADGDCVEVEISGLGRLRVDVSAETAVSWEQTRLRIAAAS